MDIYEYAKMMRSMNEHEDKLREQRISRLLTAQAFLFAATSLMWKSGNLEVVIALSVIGILFCIAFYQPLSKGEKAIQELKKIWHARREQENNYDGPPMYALERLEEYKKDCFWEWLWVLIVLGVAWLAILILAVK